MDSATVLAIAKKWHAKIEFPECYRTEFEKLFAEPHELEYTTYAAYDKVANKDNHRKNLIMLLFFCQELEDKYKAAGISEEILMATIKDFIISVDRYYQANGCICAVRAII